MNSLIHKHITEDGLLSGECHTILGRQIPINIVGDSAYPIHTWLVKPFGDNPNLTPQQKCFHYRLSRACIAVKTAFGHLKARWRRLMKRNDKITEHIPIVILACCILHSLCEVHGEVFNEVWLQNDSEYQQPTSPSLSTTSMGHSLAQDIRNTLMQYFYSQAQYIYFFQYHYTTKNGKWPVVNMNI